MEFSTLTTSSLHQAKTAALGIGVFTDGILSPAADAIDQASNGAIRAALEAEFEGRANTHLVLRNLPGIQAERVMLIGLGQQEKYHATTHADAEASFARLCVTARVKEAVSTLASIPCTGSTHTSRARAFAVAAGNATYHYTATLGKQDDKPAPQLQQARTWVSRGDTTDEADEGQIGRAH